MATGIDAFANHVKYAKSLGDLWLDRVLEIGAYWRAQKMFLSLKPEISGRDRIYKWTLPDHFPGGKFLRVTVSGGILVQEGRVIPWDDHGYYEIFLYADSLKIIP